MAEPSFDEAQAAYERRDFDAAYRMLSELAADGHPDAQNLLGVMYENSDGVALDFAKAASWYEKAERQGDAEAQFENGEGVPRSEERAAYWYSKAAENGLLLAQYTLGLMYRQGRGVPKDDKLAAYWLAQVADRGFAVAQLNLAIMYLRGEGVKRDPKRASELLKQASQRGHPIAQNTLGLMHIDGEGVIQDDTRAAEYFKRAASQDLAVAQVNLARMYEAGRGGGREKAPAAICRKVIEAKISGRHDIEIWGDGEQTRSFMYIDDCLKGTQLVMDAAFADPLNLGSDRLVSINTLVDIVETIAGVKLRRTYKFDAPTGVRGRNSDNTLIGQVLGWAPSIPLEEGLEKTYRWIYDQMPGV